MRMLRGGAGGVLVASPVVVSYAGLFLTLSNPQGTQLTWLRCWNKYSAEKMGVLVFGKDLVDLSHPGPLTRM